MPQTLPWHWLMAMAAWNPLPPSGCHIPTGPDCYCPKPAPMVAPCVPCLPDNYLAKPILAPAGECRKTSGCYDRKPFPVIGANNLAGPNSSDGCKAPGFFGLRPRP